MKGDINQFLDDKEFKPFVVRTLMDIVQRLSVVETKAAIWGALAGGILGTIAAATLRLIKTGG